MPKDGDSACAAMGRELALWLPMPHTLSVLEAACPLETRGCRPVTLARDA